MTMGMGIGARLNLPRTTTKEQMDRAGLHYGLVIFKRLSIIYLLPFQWAFVMIMRWEYEATVTHHTL
jgi:hypothetical protein